MSKGKCDTVTMMSYGYDPYLSSWSPYHGAIYAVLDSVAKIVANGGDFNKIRFTFQEYFQTYDGRSEEMGHTVLRSARCSQCAARIWTSVHRRQGQYVRQLL